MTDLPFDVGWLTANGAACALIAARAAGVCFTAPVLAAPGIDWRFRIVLALILGAWMIPLAAPLVGAPTSPYGLAWLVVNELLVGGLLGLSASLVVAGAKQAGDLVAAQAGMSTASLFDPETGEELTALGHLYGLLAIVAFLAVDGPLVMVEALLQSFRAVPAGRLVFERATIQGIFAQAAEALKLAVHAAAPPAVALATAGVALGWLGRLAPSVPLMALSLPIRALLGVLLVMAGLAALAACLDAAWLDWARGAF
ncbi:flagellar biosynthetic protein FliR [Planctomyces sp. SH-PL62]|uniref:flagellar biosynthetic protein FliR n=1 Tax=Planctomyces sp. SH-PL62 TaxID=1636152 RepID=UPI00078E1AE2|nr:flagellar biosynthetic protein FliR [Planctomyces sp. SH-PL62]AMV40332.1 flagellar biosynthesis protein FliR [Planctomyces sp. SH-PL62]